MDKMAPLLLNAPANSSSVLPLLRDSIALSLIPNRLAAVYRPEWYIYFQTHDVYIAACYPCRYGEQIIRFSYKFEFDGTP